jgi:hypothetical protein
MLFLPLVVLPILAMAIVVLVTIVAVAAATYLVEAPADTWAEKAYALWAIAVVSGVTIFDTYALAAFVQGVREL